MSKLFKNLQTLNNNNISYCFNVQNNVVKYYNLAIDDNRGARHYFSADNIKTIEDSLDIMWGHLFKTLPMPMPMPRMPKP